MIKSVIFDFDGVILESAIIKTEAFAEVVNNYPKNKAEEFVSYHMTHMGISRHVKFRYFIENILNETYSDEKERQLSSRFEQIVFNRIMACPFVPGAYDFLERNYTKYDMYIASGTPEDEMNRIVDGRGLRRFFVDVYGTPSRKNEIISSIMDNKGYAKREVVFVGDAETDMRAAQELGITFIGRNTPDNKEIFSDITHKVDNLLEIENIVMEIN